MAGAQMLPIEGEVETYIKQLEPIYLGPVEKAVLLKVGAEKSKHLGVKTGNELVESWIQEGAWLLGDLGFFER